MNLHPSLKSFEASYRFPFQIVPLFYSILLHISNTQSNFIILDKKKKNIMFYFRKSILIVICIVILYFLTLHTTCLRDRFSRCRTTGVVVSAQFSIWAVDLCSNSTVPVGLLASSPHGRQLCLGKFAVELFTFHFK